jgi:hypothetical protein
MNLRIETRDNDIHVTVEPSPGLCLVGLVTVLVLLAISVGLNLLAFW